jgi:site-specific recombinase XerD
MTPKTESEESNATQGRERRGVTRVLKSFTEYLAHERGVAAATIRGYRFVIRRFLTEVFEGQSVRPEKLTPTAITHFMLCQGGGARHMISGLRSFLRFVFLRGMTKTDLTVCVFTVPRWRLASLPKYLEPEKVKGLLRACDRNTAIGRRDYAILLLLARLGLRGVEIVALELEDVNWRDGEIVVRGKGKLLDKLPLLHDVGAALAAYVRRDRRGTTRRLFTAMKSPYQGFVNGAAINEIVQKAMRRAGVEMPAPRVGSHVLRHSLATALLHGGASMDEIGDVLRHRSPNTTAIYAKVDITGLRALAQPWPQIGGAR